jgi:hypothetical protein
MEVSVYFSDFDYKMVIFLSQTKGAPKHFVNITGESKNFKMLEFPLNQLQTYYGYLYYLLSFMSIDCIYFFPIWTTKWWFSWVKLRVPLNIFFLENKHCCYVKINEPNALKLYISLFFYNGSYIFRQNNAILRERLFSSLSHFSVNMVGDRSEYNKITQ